METKQKIFEEWRDVIGYEGIYHVSNLGNIKSLDRIIPHARFRFVHRKEKLMKLVMVDGYYIISLSKNDISSQFRVHQLVAIAFIPNPKNKPYVNHIDGIRHHNSVTNLEWCTPQENNEHAVRIGLIKTSYDHSNATLTREEAYEIHQLHSMYRLNTKIAATEYGVSRTTIYGAIHLKYI